MLNTINDYHKYYHYLAQIELNNISIKKLRRSIKWNYLFMFLHFSLLILNIIPLENMNVWNIIAASCWFICLVFDYFNHRKRKKEINNIETKNLNLLKEYNHDEWVKVMRTKKLSRVLETIR